MAKRKIDPKAKRPHETFMQWRLRVTRMEQEERDRGEPIVPVEAQRHGDYRSEFVTDVDDGTKAYTKVNRGGSPVERWIASGRLTQPQQVVIAMCCRLWRLAWPKQKLTASYGERIPMSSSVEYRATNEIEARDDLDRIQSYFPGPMQAYWRIFENVCRHEEPAGVAGSKLNYGDRDAATRAHQIVCFVADYVAAREGL